MTVKAIKLVSGEELIGEVVHEEKDDYIAMKNLLIIAMQRSPAGDLNIGFIPFAPYLGKNITFDFYHKNLIFVKEVDDMMANQYNSIFGGIVTPPKTLILD